MSDNHFIQNDNNDPISTQPNYQYSNSNNNYGPTEPQPPKKKNGITGIIVAVAAAGVIAGAILTGFVILPAINRAFLAPIQQFTQQAATLPGQESADANNSTPPAMDAPKQDNGAKPILGGSSEAPQLGGNSVPIEDGNNPVPEIAESAKKGVVGVNTYNKTLVSGEKPVEQRISSGTGFVISKDGYILTNNHVIAGGNLIKIVTNDGDEHVAELIGKDSDTELAVLKVEGLNIEPLAIGNSDEVRTGELVVAIGNPLGDQLQNTVTVGYLSSASRQVSPTGTEMTMLQTDAAINPGNSGGPLLNSQGQVIGINTMKSIYAGTDEYGNNISAEGIGFAIPISDAMDIVETLIRDGAIVKPGIGFSYEPISAEDAELWGTPKGIIIKLVQAGSPAQQAGLRVNDIITQIDGVDLTAENAEVPTFSKRQVGDKIPAIVWREGVEYQTEFVLSDLNKLIEEPTVPEIPQQQDQQQQPTLPF